MRIASVARVGWRPKETLWLRNGASYVALNRGPYGFLRPLSTSTRPSTSSIELATNEELRRPSNLGQPINDQISSEPQFSEMTPLLKELIERIKLRGAMTVHEYMSACLTHPIHGYYTTQEALGKMGDFVTAPEISQTFGEMIGVWCVAMWQKMGEPESIRIVEVGGGKGTLMKDVLRTVSSFKKFSSALKGVTMVDASPRMRNLQKEALTGESSVSEHKKEDKPKTAFNEDKVECEVGLPFTGKSLKATPSWAVSKKITTRWVNTVSEIDAKEPVLIIAQELFDALPVHQFQFSDGRWCEKLIDIAEQGIDTVTPDLQNLKHHLRFVLSRGPTPAAKILLKGALLQQAEEGQQIEVGSSAAAVAQDIALILTKQKGACIIIDYGENHPLRDSLRGIKDHKFVHPLREPGLVDLSVDVDFSYLNKSVREGLKALKASPPNVIGPISQAEFLRNMGIEHRVAALLRAKEGQEDEQLKIFLGYKRLVEGMGTSYKVMVMSSNTEDSPGFAKIE